MIPISRPSLTERERSLLVDAFDSTWISSRGAYIERFENEFARRCDAGHALTVSNGTVALHLALVALELQPGDEVLVPSLTYVATANAVRYCGAVPVFVDASEEDWCIDVEAAAAAVTSRTVGIISADVYGHPCDYMGLRTLAQRHGLWWVSDSAEALFASRGGVKAGAPADVTTFSFFGNKVITCGEGGAVTTSDDGLADRMRVLKNQGNSPVERYRHDVLGYNYRLTNLQAAVLVGQLERCDELVAAREDVLRTYEKELKRYSRVVMQPVCAGVRRSPWLTSILIHGASRAERDGIIDHLSAVGIESRPLFIPMQKLPHLAAFAQGVTPVAELLSQTGVSLPTYPGLTPVDLRKVVDGLGEALQAAS